MLWGLLVVLATVYAVVIFGCALAVLLSRPKIPQRPSFFEMHNRAIRMRDVVLPAVAAAILGFLSVLRPALLTKVSHRRSPTAMN